MTLTHLFNLLQECLDRHVLMRADREGVPQGEQLHETRLYPGPGNKVFASRYRLPAELTCKHCVLQWRYIAGNNWGMCPNGTGAVGCGPQEEFRACSDVAVVDSAGDADETPLAPEDTGDEGEEVPTPADRDYSSSGLFVLLTALCALAGSATVISLMYLYFYHAGRVKSWLAALAARRRDRKVVPPISTPPTPPAPPPRHKRPNLGHSNGTSNGAIIVC